MSNLSSFNNWQTYALTDLAHYHNGFAFKPKDWAQDGVKIIRIEQLNKPDGQYDHYAGIYPPVNQINDGDLIFSWSATLKVVIWNHGKAVLNQHLFRVDAKDGFEKQYIYYVLDHHMESLAGGSHGSTMKHIKRGELQKYRLPIPPLNFQRKIASILSAIDRTIAKTEALIKKYQQIKAGLMHDLFTRGIGANGKLRPHREEAPELYRESAIGWIPKEWEVKSCQDIFDVDSGITLGAHRRPKNNPRPYLRVANVFKERIVLNDIAYLEASDEENIRYKLNTYDLLLVEGHASIKQIGRCGLVENNAEGMLFQNHLFRLKPVLVSPYFAVYLLNSHIARKYWKTNCSTSSGLNTINRTMLGKMSFGIPSTDEQLCIERKLCSISKFIANEGKYLEKLTDKKSGLMHDLLTGKVSVNVDSDAP